MKKFFLPLLLTVLSFAVKAQTSVSGGIFTNTTWTPAGSPYIVTDTLVVFPGVTLSIQPGVVVKFDDHMQLEMRQSSLIALGTATDPITFTGNTSSTPGSWSNVILNGGTAGSRFNYCKFSFAATGLLDNRDTGADTLVLKNSDFSYNSTGLGILGGMYAKIDSCNFDHNTNYGASPVINGGLHYCTFSYNYTGLECQFSLVKNSSFHDNTFGVNTYSCCSSFIDCVANHNYTGMILGGQDITVKQTVADSNSGAGIVVNSSRDSVINCETNYNGAGVYDTNPDGFWPNYILKNTIEYNHNGVQLTIANDHFSCNKICSNLQWNLLYDGVDNVDVSNNYWCTADSAATQALIYDGHTDVSYGLASFMPLDTACYLTGGTTTGIAVYAPPAFSFGIFPNPAADHLTVELPAEPSKTEITIFNMLGALEYSSTLTKQRTDLDISAMAKGIYFIQITSGKGIARKKFIKQ